METPDQSKLTLETQQGTVLRTKEVLPVAAVQAQDEAAVEVRMAAVLGCLPCSVCAAFRIVQRPQYICFLKIVLSFNTRSIGTPTLSRACSALVRAASRAE